MSITVSTTLGNALLDLIDSTINTNGPGSVQFATDSTFSTVLAEITLNNPAFGSATDKTIALDVDPALSATVVENGTVSHFRFCDGTGTEVLRGTVGVSNADWIFDVVVWATGGTIIVNSGGLSVA
jgi:hypothetical protein